VYRIDGEIFGVMGKNEGIDVRGTYNMHFASSGVS